MYKRQAVHRVSHDGGQHFGDPECMPHAVGTKEMAQHRRVSVSYTHLDVYKRQFFNSAGDVLKTLVVALGAGLGVWGAVNLMEGYGGDNPSANAHIR